MCLAILCFVSPVGAKDASVGVSDNVPATHKINDTIDGQGAHRIFYIKDGRVEIRNLAIANRLAQGTNGKGTAGGGADMGGGTN